MAGHETPYDPYIPAGSEAPKGYSGEHGGPPKTQALQGQIDDTIEAMKRNLDTVNQRGTHINELNQKTEDLQTNSKIFQRGANKVRKEMFCKNVRMTVWIAIGVAILIAILIGVLVRVLKSANR